MRNRTKCMMLLLILPLLASAQTATDPGVFSPFVSRLKATVADPEIRLTWTDSPDLQANCLVYRASFEITQETIEKASLIAELPPGRQSYIDLPPAAGTWYYAVILRTAEGERFDVLVPYRNKLVRGVELTSVITPEQNAAEITALQVKVEGTAIVLSFESNRQDRTLYLYRSTTPITSVAQLPVCVFLGKISSSQKTWSDSAPPGIAYYYAISDSVLVEQGRAQFALGKNASSAFVEIPIQRERLAGFALPDSPRRDIPLPYLMLSTDLRSSRAIAGQGTDLPASKPVSQETAQAIQVILRGLTPQNSQIPQAAILEEDRTLGDTLEERNLRGILEGSFAAKNWKQAETELQNVLALQLSDRIRQKASFYLGQVLYQQQKYQLAFLEFLGAQKALYQQGTTWIDSILSMDLDYQGK